MRKIVFFLLTLTAAVYADTAPKITLSEEAVTSESEITSIDRLIAATEASLQKQKAIKAQIVAYQKIEQECIADPSNPQKLHDLARTGAALFTAIDATGLTDYFKPEFIADLKKLKAISDKTTIPTVK